MNLHQKAKNLNLSETFWNTKFYSSPKFLIFSNNEIVAKKKKSSLEYHKYCYNHRKKSIKEKIRDLQVGFKTIAKIVQNRVDQKDTEEQITCCEIQWVWRFNKRRCEVCCSYRIPLIVNTGVSCSYIKSSTFCGSICITFDLAWIDCHTPVFKIFFT